MTHIKTFGPFLCFETIDKETRIRNFTKIHLKMFFLGKLNLFILLTILYTFSDKYIYVKFRKMIKFLYNYTIGNEIE